MTHGRHFQFASIRRERERVSCRKSPTKMSIPNADGGCVECTLLLHMVQSEVLNSKLYRLQQKDCSKKPHLSPGILQPLQQLAGKETTSTKFFNYNFLWYWEHRKAINMSLPAVSLREQVNIDDFKNKGRKRLIIHLVVFFGERIVCTVCMRRVSRRTGCIEALDQ